MLPGKKLFVYLSLAFFGLSIAGTLLHESAHCLTAKAFGYQAQLHYGMTTYEGVPENSNESFWITLAGPLQTMLTGSIGCILLFIYRKRFLNKTSLLFKQWAFIFLALFWMRQAVNFVVWLGGYFVSGNFSDRPDEIRLAQQMEWPSWSITGFTALVAMTILAWIFLRLVPAKEKLIFIAAGLTGGIVGYVLWLKILGPVMIP